MDHTAAALTADHPPARRRHRLRRLLARVLVRLRGRPPGLLDRGGLLDAGHRLMRPEHCRTAAIMVFEFEELLELAELYGRRAEREAVQQVAQALCRIAGANGLAARTGATQFTLLIPDCSPEQAVSRAVRVLGTPCRVELELDGGEAVLVPDVAADECPRAGGGLALLQQQLGERLAAHRLHRRLREQYLRRSRERYSNSR